MMMRSEKGKEKKVVMIVTSLFKKIDLSLNLRLRVPLGKTLLHAKYQSCQRNVHAKD